MPGFEIASIGKQSPRRQRRTFLIWSETPDTTYVLQSKSQCLGVLRSRYVLSTARKEIKIKRPLNTAWAGSVRHCFFLPSPFLTTLQRQSLCRCFFFRRCWHYCRPINLPCTRPSYRQGSSDHSVSAPTPFLHRWFKQWVRHRHIQTIQRHVLICRSSRVELRVGRLCLGDQGMRIYELSNQFWVCLQSLPKLLNMRSKTKHEET